MGTRDYNFQNLKLKAEETTRVTWMDKEVLGYFKCSKTN